MPSHASPRNQQQPTQSVSMAPLQPDIGQMRHYPNSSSRVGSFSNTRTWLKSVLGSTPSSSARAQMASSMHESLDSSRLLSTCGSSVRKASMPVSLNPSLLDMRRLLPLADLDLRDKPRWPDDLLEPKQESPHRLGSHSPRLAIAQQIDPELKRARSKVRSIIAYSSNSSTIFFITRAHLSCWAMKPGQASWLPLILQPSL